MTTLTPAQIQIIKDTWELPKKDLAGSGEAILFRYFEKYPHNQQKFASFKNSSLDETLKVSGKSQVFMAQNDSVLIDPLVTFPSWHVPTQASFEYCWEQQYLCASYTRNDELRDWLSDWMTASNWVFN